MMTETRAVSVDQLLRKKFIELPVEGAWKELLGSPERSGSWFIYGLSGHGKTTFNMQLAKYLTRFGKVEYDTLEEGARKSMQEAVKENRMQDCRKGSFKILDKVTIEELRARLSRKRAAKIIFIDSVQYTFIEKRAYKQLLKDFPDVLFIWISHARGKQPLGALAEAIMYDADIKIHVIGFKAYSKSRMSRGVKTKPYTIWDEGAKDYHEII
jgi:hypothetical protein